MVKAAQRHFSIMGSYADMGGTLNHVEVIFSGYFWTCIDLPELIKGHIYDHHRGDAAEIDGTLRSGDLEFFKFYTNKTRIKRLTYSLRHSPGTNVWRGTYTALIELVVLDEQSQKMPPGTKSGEVICQITELDPSIIYEPLPPVQTEGEAYDRMRLLVHEHLQALSDGASDEDDLGLDYTADTED